MDSKAGWKEEKTCGEKEIDSFLFCSYLCCYFPGAAHRANRRKNIQLEYSGSFEMLLITDENEIYLTEGIENDFTLNENFSDMEIYVIMR